MACGGSEPGRRNAGCKASQQQAAGEFEDDLYDGGGIVVFHPEELEAESKEEREAR